ncbi:CTB family bacteriocin [Leptolyngbya sp. AN03gr2]|uniref:CTB family bacteriocin n=1 Tax=unclassified Leptolyngbya TaxID=2650499 RepID=UPI003D3234BC
MSEQIKMHQSTELSVEELDVIAGGASLDTDIDTVFKQEAFASEELVSNGADGFKSASATVAKQTISEADFEKRLEV